MKPLFTVVIPTYGRADFLQEALTSVLKQTVDDLECVVVDDAGSQAVPQQSDPRVRVMRHAKNRGAAAARNTGIEHARGRYVAFLDDDDVFTHDRLEWALAGLEEAPVTVCWARYMDDPPKRKRKLNGWVADTIVRGVTPHLGAAAVDRGQVLRFDERFRTLEDVDWWIRTAQSMPVTTIPEFGCLIRRHPGERRGYGTERRIEDSLALLKVHESYFSKNRRAAALRWHRIGLMYARQGQRVEARRALHTSMRLWPRPGAARAWTRTFAPSG